MALHEHLLSSQSVVPLNAPHPDEGGLEKGGLEIGNSKTMRCNRNVVKRLLMAVMVFAFLLLAHVCYVTYVQHDSGHASGRVAGEFQRYYVPDYRPKKKGCFSADALVESLHGHKMISDIKIGEFLRTSEGMSPYILSGHSDPDVTSMMVNVKTETNHSVSVTPDHYFVLEDGRHVLATNICKGDMVKVQHRDGLMPSRITERIVIKSRGMFNPYTVAGDIIVNGILMSCHSAWFLEDQLFLGADSIVAIYRVLLKPVSSIYFWHPRWLHNFNAKVGAYGGPLSNLGAWNITVSALSSMLM